MMTTPPPPPPPSGYGGPPYGGPPQPPPPGSPYGAPGAPQPPYGSQPPGPPGGWGGPPPQGPQGPQPGGNNKGKLIAIIGACVVVIALAITLTFALGGSSDGDAEADASNSQETPQSDASDDPDDASGEPDDDASDDATDDDEADDGTEKLSLPQTLLGGDYKLLQDMSEQFDREAPRGQDITGLGGSFQATSGEDTLVVAAYDGNIGNPTIAKRDFLQGTGSGANAKITVQPKDFDVDDADSPVRCQVVTQTQGNMEVPLPTCVWADGDTLISAIHTDPGQVNGNAQSIKLDTHAERLMDILDDFGGDT